MKIGIIGSGVVGQTLGSGFAAAGHDVKLGTREPWGDKAQAWAGRAGGRAAAASFRDAAAFADVAVLATLWSGTESALRIAGPENLKGKVVIDATNPLQPSPSGPPGLALGHTDSGGEQVQRWLPQSRVVKCFNIVGNAHMVKPQFPGGPPDMLICGNDAEAKRVVNELCKSLGWPDTLDIGGIEGSRVLEPMAIAWVLCGFRANSWNHAFKLLRK